MERITTSTHSGLDFSRAAFTAKSVSPQSVISAQFWRSLSRVGNADTVRVLGTPYCCKGEPSQTIRVGHASPACVFTNVDVFGGEA